MSGWVGHLFIILRQTVWNELILRYCINVQTKMVSAIDGMVCFGCLGEESMQSRTCSRRWQRNDIRRSQRNGEWHNEGAER